nr:MAG TPA: hypothetical protein [Caudoviricetes sp.]
MTNIFFRGFTPNGVNPLFFAIQYVICALPA